MDKPKESPSRINSNPPPRLNGDISPPEIFSDQEEIQEYFIPGFDADEVTSLWSLKQKLTLLNAFTTLFRGEPTGVMVRFHVLSEMSLRPIDIPYWSLIELRQHFAYLTDTAFETVIKRLRNGDLISYDREGNRYSVTPLGLQVNSAVSYFLKTFEDEGLGLLTGVLFAGQAMGNLSKEELAHLMNRLCQLEQELISAIESASEPTILKARERFEVVWQRIEKGTEVIRAIAKNQDMDRETHKLGQRVAEAQSRLARATSLFQRAMNDIDRQRIHLGNSGISTSDLNKYLMTKTVEGLTDLFKEAIGFPVQPRFLLTDVLADVAEYELVERLREEKEEWKLPDLVHSSQESNILEEETPHLRVLIGDMKELKDMIVRLKEVVPKESFEVSSYRFSMLGLGDHSLIPGSDGPIAELIHLPFSVLIEQGSEEVMRDGVSLISRGVIRREDS